MRHRKFLLALFLLPSLTCAAMTRYCDSSAGFYVNDNGDYSGTYCTIHAVMDLQKIAGLCLWRGGVAKITEKLEVLCNDGSISELSTLEQMTYQAGIGFTIGTDAKEKSKLAVVSHYQYINQ